MKSDLKVLLLLGFALFVSFIIGEGIIELVKLFTAF